MRPAFVLQWPAARWPAGDVLTLAAIALVTGVAAMIPGRSGFLLVSFVGLAMIFAQRPAAGAVLIAATVPFHQHIAVARRVAGSLPGIDRFSTIAFEPGERVMFTSETWAQEERSAHWGAAGAVVREHPVTGVGAGMFGTRYRELTPEWRFRVPRGQAHNGDSHMAAQAGIPGMVAFGAWVGGALILLAGAARRSAGSERRIIVGVLAAMTATGLEYLAPGSLLPWMALLIAVGRSLDTAAATKGWA